MLASARRVGVTLVVVVAIASCGDDGGDLEAFCQRADGAGTDITLDVLEPSIAAEELDHAAAVYEPIRDVAPEEIRDDLDLLIEFVTELRDDLRAVDPSDPTSGFEATAALEERFAEVDRASEELAAYQARHCGGSATDGS